MFTHALASFVAVAQSIAPAQAPHHPAPPPVHIYGLAPSAPEQAHATRQGGWIGVALTGDTPGAPGVSQVVDGSPGEHAGISVGDRIVSFNGGRVESSSALIESVRNLEPGTSVDVQVRREISVELDGEHKSDKGAFIIGVVLASSQNVGDDEGVTVRSVNDDSPAAHAGIQSGDVLLTVEGKRVASSAHVSNVLKPIDVPRAVRVELARTLHVTLGTPPPDASPRVAQPFLVHPVQPAQPSPPAPPTARTPRAPTPPPANTDALLEEVRALSQQLRDLREQIARLRDELEQLQRRR